MKIYIVLQLDGSCLAFNYCIDRYNFIGNPAYCTLRCAFKVFQLGNGPLKRHHLKCEALITFTSVELPLSQLNLLCTEFMDWLIRTLLKNTTKYEEKWADEMVCCRSQSSTHCCSMLNGYGNWVTTVCFFVFIWFRYWLSYFPCSCKLQGFFSSLDSP